MSAHSWISANVDYGRRILHSGLEGARSGEADFLKGQSLSPLLNQAARYAWRTAAVGACLGVLGSCPGNRRMSAVRTLVGGLLGGALGFGVGLAWENRQLAASVAHSAMKSIGRVRDEHWLERHPIDYA
jgi:hypothetical protein